MSEQLGATRANWVGSPITSKPHLERGHARTGAPSSSHPEHVQAPQWPCPTIVVIEEAARARAAIERIAQRGERALGVAFELRTPSGSRLRSGEDARTATLASVAIAVPEAKPEAQGHEPLSEHGAGRSKVLVLPQALLERCPLETLLPPLLERGDSPPAYLVFADAHRALGLLARHGLDAPPATAVSRPPPRCSPRVRTGAATIARSSAS